MQKYSKLRVGKILISSCVFDNGDPKALNSVFRDCFITRCEYLFSRGCFEYTMHNEKFREIAEGEVIPTYTVIISTGKKAQRVRIKFRETKADGSYVS
jgi:hypothetical protein